MLLWKTITAFQLCACSSEAQMTSLIQLFLYVTSQGFLSCGRHCFRHWGGNSKKERQTLCFQMASILVEEYLHPKQINQMISWSYKNKTTWYLSLFAVQDHIGQLSPSHVAGYTTVSIIASLKYGPPWSLSLLCLRKKKKWKGSPCNFKDVTQKWHTSLRLTPHW